MSDIWTFARNREEAKAEENIAWQGQVGEPRFWRRSYIRLELTPQTTRAIFLFGRPVECDLHGTAYLCTCL